MAWLKERIKYLDAKYGYLDQGVLAQNFGTRQHWQLVQVNQQH